MVKGKYYSSFFQDGKDYNDYYFGSITYDNGEYIVDPTASDEAYTADEKKDVLNGLLDEKLMIRNSEDKAVLITKENALFLQMYSALRSNMYGGLVIDPL